MPTMTLAVGATFAKLAGERPEHTGGGLRGKVNGFSRESRKRLLDLLNMVPCEELQKAAFLTLTYPDNFPTDAQVWKRDLDVFLKRAKREYPRSVWIWRLEWKQRLSGENKGKLAPHFHLFCLNVKRLDLKWLGRSWYETVGSGDERHLKAGTSATRIRTRRGVMAYASKYVAKPSESPSFWVGRVWGIVDRELLPVVLLVADLTWQQFYKIRRVLRGWMENMRGRRVWTWYRGQGVTSYLDDGTAKRLLTWAAA